MFVKASAKPDFSITQTMNNRTNNVQELIDLKKLLDADIITQEEFNAKKEKFLNNENSFYIDNSIEKNETNTNKKNIFQNTFVQIIIATGIVLGIIFLSLVVLILENNNTNNSDTSFELVSEYNTKINLDKFNQIQTGMTYEEVVLIIGEEGTIMSEVDMNIGQEYKTVIYYWYADNGISNANITFQGGKVVAKAQIGLR